MNEPAIRPHDARLVPAVVAGWTAMITGVVHGSSTALSLAVVWAVVAGGALCCRRRLGRPAFGLIALAVIGGCYAGAAALHAWDFEASPVVRAADQRAWVSAAVVVREDPRRLRSPGPRMVSIRTELTQIDIAGTAIALGGRVLVRAPADGWDHLVPGQSVTLRGRLAPPDRADLTLAVIRVAGPPIHLDAPGYVAKPALIIRESLAGAASDALPPDRAGLLPGLVVGDVSALSEDVESSFRAAGLTHLTAVSGANFAILMGAVLLLTRVVGVGPRTTAVVCAVVLLAFVVVARPSPSVLRAAVMGGIGLLALVTGRRRQAVPALCTAVLGLLVWWPELSVDFGFALSVSATGALVVVAPVWVDWLRRHGWGRAPAEVVSVAAAAHAVTAPLVAAMAGTFSVVGVLANIAVAPVVAPITVVGAIAAVVAPWASGLASLTLELASAPLWWLIEVATWAASLPGAGLETPTGALGAALVMGFTAVVLVSLRLRILRMLLGGLLLVTVFAWIASSLL
ncbi:ComEC/Rec2 family competence protein [Rhodococcus sp. P1Y]|uniref:ComEC/Rec2 family competence protein n=1 Tax=Rhodococcus sp. P1Y TaxID=1302308 RepID=UPI000EAE3137|nr:ComEC/Rec2 family competence protein [Rhodococcus sp. P1Y]AYJ50159.1 ComEC family competence protein [Rhodococcus sp. P1Y]